MYRQINESTLAKTGYCNKRSTKNRPMSDDRCTRADIKTVSMTRTDSDNAINRPMHTTQRLDVRYAESSSAI